METTQLIDPDLHNHSTSFLGCYDECWDNESYIEIALEPAPTQHRYSSFDDDEYRESSDNELQLRISFSSTVAFAGPSTGESPSDNSSFPDEKPCKVEKTTIKSRVQFPAVNRFLNTLLSSSRPLSAPEIGESRKGSNIGKRREGGGIIMKFLMKLRSKNIGTLIESFLRPQQVVSSPPRSSGSKNQRRKSGKNLLGNAGVFEINLAGMKGVVESISRPNLGLRDGKTKQSSRSSKTSPVHPRDREMRTRAHGGECSIQAAIAHCKSSYGQLPDFQVQTEC